LLVMVLLRLVAASEGARLHRRGKVRTRCRRHRRRRCLRRSSCNRRAAEIAIGLCPFLGWVQTAGSMGATPQVFAALPATTAAAAAAAAAENMPPRVFVDPPLAARGWERKGEGWGGAVAPSFSPLPLGCRSLLLLFTSRHSRIRECVKRTVGVTGWRPGRL
jgi:hypothetical protein